MEINKPYLVLVKNDDKFELLSITYCDKFNVKTDSNINISSANSENLVKIEIFGSVDEAATAEIKDLRTLNPIVHHIELGSLVQDDITNDNLILEEIEVSFSFRGNSTLDLKLGGKSKIKTVTAGGHVRPKKP